VHDAQFARNLHGEIYSAKAMMEFRWGALVKTTSGANSRVNNASEMDVLANSWKIPASMCHVILGTF
jgi:hypothetical protein